MNTVPELIRRGRFCIRGSGLRGQALRGAAGLAGFQADVGVVIGFRQGEGGGQGPVGHADGVAVGIRVIELADAGDVIQERARLLHPGRSEQRSLP